MTTNKAAPGKRRGRVGDIGEGIGPPGRLGDQRREAQIGRRMQLLAAGCRPACRTSRRARRASSRRRRRPTIAARKVSPTARRRARGLSAARRADGALTRRSSPAGRPAHDADDASGDADARDRRRRDAILGVARIDDDQRVGGPFVAEQVGRHRQRAAVEQDEIEPRVQPRAERTPARARRTAAPALRRPTLRRARGRRRPAPRRR